MQIVDMTIFLKIIKDFLNIALYVMVEKVILFGIRFLVYLSDLFCISFGGMHVHAYVFKPKDDNNYIYRSWKVDKIYLFIFSLSTYI